jgi:ADP-ribosyl-[dinitrogen reductase] hydrolase
MNDRKNRIYGLFFGQLTGDAIGSRYEFLSKDSAIKKLKKDIVNNELPMLGCGPFNLKKGQYADDSELALGIWYSLLVRKTYDIDHIVKMCYKWYQSGPFDIGEATTRAFSKGCNKNDIKTNASIQSLSNGCLMKMSPLGALKYLFPTNDFSLKNVAKEVCELTNPNIICIDMSICYLHAINTAIKTGDPKKVYIKALSMAKLPITKMILEDAKTKYTPVKLINNYNLISEIMPDSSHQGYIGIAFQNAFYHLLNTKNYTDVMIHIIGMGGDTDTNCCIVGALFGACHGVKKIEKDWIISVLNFTNYMRRINIYKALDHQHIFELLSRIKINYIYKF